MKCVHGDLCHLSSIIYIIEKLDTTNVHKQIMMHSYDEYEGIEKQVRYSRQCYY